jgi:hypothetical protein
MAGFSTHIAFSTLAGAGYAAAGYYSGLPLSTTLVAGGLCSFAGMLPDLDSDSGVPVREMSAFIAAVIPVLMIPRFQRMGFDHEHIVLAAGAIYLLIRFVMGELFRRYTVHRGMWHSLPAAAIAGLLTYLVASNVDPALRLFKAGAVVLGFVTHLVLDELWSFDVRRGKLQVKSSVGTALKLWTTKSLWANVSTYGKLLLLVVLVIGDPYLMERLGVEQQDLPRSPREWLQRVVDRVHGATAVKGYPSSDSPARPPDTAPPVSAAPYPAPPAAERPYAETARMPSYYPAGSLPGRR